MFSFPKVICTFFFAFSYFKNQVFAFNPIRTASTKPNMKTFIYNGDIAPLGYFDPLQLTLNADESTVRYLREAEIHHSRIAMIAWLMLPTIDYFSKDDLAIDYFSKNHGEFNQLGFFYMAIFETARLLTFYESPTDKLFQLKDNVQPGMLNKYVPFDENMSNIELSNGRLAMIGVLGYIAQELVTQQKIIS